MSTDSVPSLSSLLSQISSVVSASNGIQRATMIAEVQSFAQSLQAPEDVLRSIVFSSALLPVARIGCNLGLFEKLSSKSYPQSVESLASQTGCNPKLLSKLLRYLASVGCISSTGKDEYSANEVTNTLVSPGGTGSICTYFDMMRAPMDSLPSFLASTSYQPVLNGADCPFQQGHRTKLSAFEWMHEHPEQVEYFNHAMEAWDAGMPNVFEALPIFKAKAIEAAPLESAGFVDIGGNIGHQSEALLATCPELKGKIVLQDLESVISQAPERDGIEAMVQDIFEAQRVTGASMYYTRHVLHDWTDDKALQILTNIKKAMGAKSVLFIDEVIVPDTGAHWRITALEMLLMACNGAVERTHQEWQSLVERAGLHVVKTHSYSPSTGHGVIECSLCDS